MDFGLSGHGTGTNPAAQKKFSWLEAIPKYYF